MKEFMFFILSDENPQCTSSPEEMQKHVERVGGYLRSLASQGRMKSAQPLAFEGVRIGGNKGSFIDGPYNETKEVISGYYHILADDMEDAIRIAKEDPRFEENGWRVEVREIIKVEGIN